MTLNQEILFLFSPAELSVSSSNNEKGSKFKIHAIQILPLKSFKVHMYNRIMELSANTQISHKFAVEVRVYYCDLLL